MPIRTAPRRGVALALTLPLALAGLLGAFGVPRADASTPPVVNRDGGTVTSDPLPTAQIDPAGWVEDQAIAGDTVYAAGSFSAARPAGAAVGAPTEVPRNNLLAYSLSAGNLSSSFAPAVNSEVRVLALSPDRSRLYVGGDFTSVDGVTHNHLFAVDTATGQVDPSFTADVNGPVYGISATSSTVYIGGQFTLVNGNTHGRLAALSATSGSPLSGFIAKTDGSSVRAVLVAPGGNVVVGGSFATIGRMGSTTTVAAPGSASLDPGTGETRSWNVNQVVKQYGGQGSVLSLKTDGTTVFGSGFWYGAAESNYEGAWAADPADGSVTWLADCHGDTYDTTVDDGVLYTASHHHDCSNIGGFPEQTPKRIEWRATAFTTSVQGDVQPNALMADKFKDFTGYKAPAVVSWFPQFTNPSCPKGDCSARLYANQPTLTVESSGGYVVMGGQFPMVNSKPQQGLVRFAKPSAAPKKDGPRLYPSGGPTVRAVAGDVVRVTASPWDRDGSVLSSVELWRTDSAAPVFSASDVTALWWRTTVAYTDTDVSPGTSYGYYVKTRDADGNVATSPTTSVTTPSGTLSGSAYAKQVLADGATGYWRFDDAATTSSTYRTGATDFAGAQDLTLGAGVATAGSGVLGSALTTDGSTSASAATATPAPAPQTFSAEAWFKTTSTSGGQVIGYGNTATTLRTGAPVFEQSYLHDRQVYLTASGQLVYYLNPGTARTLQTPSTKAYNDGSWHQVVATLSPTSGMVLYVDGAKVASWSSIRSAGDYRGYWRIAGDNPGRVPGAGSGSGYLQGSFDEASVYPTALSATQVADHYRDATGAGPATAPTS